jgi:multidrug resistance efflux pump
VPEIELGRVSAAGQPTFAIVADTGLWVDANPKESDLTYVHVGLPAKVSVDTFPDKEWKGTSFVLGRQAAFAATTTGGPEDGPSCGAFVGSRFARWPKRSCEP